VQTSKMETKTADDDWFDDGPTQIDPDIAQMERQFTNLGYKEGLSEGKEEGLKKGYHQGLVQGAPIGFMLGQLEGSLRALVTFSQKEGLFLDSQTECQQLIDQVVDLQTQLKTLPAFSKHNESHHWTKTFQAISASISLFFSKMSIPAFKPSELIVTIQKTE